MKPFYWTKRLGGRHISKTGSGRTYCGKPMLGNNYATVRDDAEPCRECELFVEEEKVIQEATSHG